MGGWIALPAVILLGSRANRYRKDGAISAHPPSNIPFLALGAWVLVVGWFGFNCDERTDRGQALRPGSGELADGHGGRHVGGVGAGQERPGLRAQRPAGRAGGCVRGLRSDAPAGSAGGGCRGGSNLCGDVHAHQNRWKIDDVLGVWPLHGLCGTWGGLAAGIFGSKALGGLGGVSFSAQLIGSTLGVAWALVGGLVVYGILKSTVGLRLTQEEEFDGADLSIHKISATPDREVSW